MANKTALFLAISLFICLCGIGALSVYSFNLKAEVDTLKQQNKELRLSSFRSSPQNNQTFPQPWINSWNSGIGFNHWGSSVEEMINSFSSKTNLFTPFVNNSVDVSLQEDDDKYRVSVKIPEGQEISLKTELEGNQLYIQGQILSEENRSAPSLNSSVSQSTKFSRTLTLTEQIDELGMKVVNNKSEYTITIPKV